MPTKHKIPYDDTFWSSPFTIKPHFKNNDLRIVWGPRAVIRKKSNLGRSESPPTQSLEQDYESILLITTYKVNYVVSHMNNKFTTAFSKQSRSLG
jgi:hypothetical protein